MSITVQKKLEKLDLPRSEKQIAVAMASHLWENAPEKGTWVGAAKIAAKCGVSERTVLRAILELKKKGILRLVGYAKGKQAKMPKYTFHPENGRILAIFCPREPDTVSGSESPNSPENLPTAAREPDISAENMTPCPREHDMVSPDKALRKLKEKERERTAADPLSYFVWLLSNYDGLNLTGKERSQIEKLVRGAEYDLSVLRQATDRALDALDVKNSFDRAGDKLATNLETQCKTVIRLREKEQKTREMLAQCTANEQKRAAEEQLARINADQEEQALIEDQLPIETQKPELEEQEC
jgi:hypothetical protein